MPSTKTHKPRPTAMPSEHRRQFLFTPGLPQAKVHRHVPSIYNTDPEKTLRLTMVDVLRLFADMPHIRHFDDVRRLNLMGELEARVAAYDEAGGNMSFSSSNLFMLTTPEAFEAVPGAKFYELGDCIALAASHN